MREFGLITHDISGGVVIFQQSFSHMSFNSGSACFRSWVFTSCYIFATLHGNIMRKLNNPHILCASKRRKNISFFFNTHVGVNSLVNTQATRRPRVSSDAGYTNPWGIPYILLAGYMGEVKVENTKTLEGIMLKTTQTGNRQHRVGYIGNIHLCNDNLSRVIAPVPGRTHKRLLGSSEFNRRIPLDVAISVLKPLAPSPLHIESSNSIYYRPLLLQQVKGRKTSNGVTKTCIRLRA